MGVVGARAYWEADVSVPLDDRPIGRIVCDVAAADPDRIALQWPVEGALRSWTWAEVRDDSARFARRLLTCAAPGDVIAIFAGNSPDWIFFEYAAALAGITMTAVNTALADVEVAHVVRASKAKVVFADAEYRGSALLRRVQAVVPEVPAYDLASWRALPAITTPLPQVGSKDPFLVQFTSGTTGRPKGAVLSHLAAFNCARYQILRLGGTADDNWLNVMPMHHVGGSVSVLLSMLAVGGTTTLCPAFEAGLVLRLIEQSRATIIGLVPTMELALLDHPALGTTDVSTLRLVSSGGSVVATSLTHRVESELGVTVVNAYGQSESPSAIMTCPDDDNVVKAETIGRPLDHRDVRIACADGSTAAFGEIGELLMRSPMTMDRYLDHSDDGSAPDDDWLHTGDLCAMDSGGVIRMHGRARDVIIRGGENIYPAEVEAVMLTHPAIADIAIVGVPDPHWGEVPVGCYRANAGSAVTEGELIEFARKSLAGFKVPRRWVALENFPITAAGKVKRYVLQEQMTARISEEPRALP